MSEEVRTNKRRRSESEEQEDDGGDVAGADVVGAGAPGTDALDGGHQPESAAGEEAGDQAADQAAADAAAAAAEPPKMPPMQTMQLPVQMTHQQPRVEEKQVVETYYKPEQQAVDNTAPPPAAVPTHEYKVPGMNVMAGMGGISNISAVNNVAGMGVPGVNPAAMGVNASALSSLGGMGGLATLGVPGMSLGGVGTVDLNQQLLAAQQRQYEMNLVKAQMNNQAAAAAAAAARSQPKPQPPVPTGRKSAPTSYEPTVQLTASGRPARARRVNYAELAGALDDEEEDDQSNLVPNWARRRRKTGQDQDRDYGVGVGSSARSSAVQMGGGGGGGNAAMYGVAGAGNFNAAAPRAAAPAAGVNLYGLAGNAALAGQQGWPGGQVVWGQNPGMAGPYGALQSLAAAQNRPQVAAQQFLLQPGAGRAVAPNLMQDMQLMLARGADGQGGMPGAGQQR